MYCAEGTGKTIEKAIENALFELKATREDVDIKIINEGGLFKKAKVVVTISEDAREKYAKKAVKKAEEKETEKQEKTEAKETAKAEKAEIKAEAKKEKKEVKAAEKKEQDVAKENDEDEDEEISEKPIKNIDPEEFLKNFFEKAGKTVTIEITEDENYKTYHIDGEDLGEMIGHRGECFYAISRLLSAVVGKQDKKTFD